MSHAAPFLLPARRGLGLASVFRRRRAAPRIVGRLEDVEPGEARVAEDVYAGLFSGGGIVVDAGEASPFVDRERPAAFLADLHGFSWLRHLAAADTAIARSNGRALLDDWARAGGAAPRLSRAPAVAARRLHALLSHGETLCRDAAPAFRARFGALLADHVARLDRAARRLPPCPGRAHAAIATLAAASVLDLPRSFADRAAARAAAVLDEDVLPDGCPPSRAADDLVDLLIALVPAVAAARERGIVLPEGVVNALDRAGPMLAFFRRADGSLSAFNGTGATRAVRIAALEARLAGAGAPPHNARYGGYQRMEAGDAVVLLDAGAAPPPAFAGRAHAGPLSFELSDASGAIVVNCGAAPPGAGEALARRLRATAAHSTLSLDGASAGEIGPARTDAEGRLAEPLRHGAGRVAAERRTDRTGRVMVRAVHDGWRRRFGWLHERTLTLEADGGGLAGRDSLLGAGADVPFAIRFHLAPGVKTSLSPSGRAVVLTAADGAIWRFGTDEGVDLSLAESLFVAPDGRLLPARQIRLVARSGARPVVRWRLERQLRGH